MHYKPNAFRREDLIRQIDRKINIEEISDYIERAVEEIPFEHRIIPPPFEEDQETVVLDDDDNVIGLTVDYKRHGKRYWKDSDEKSRVNNLPPRDQFYQHVVWQKMEDTRLYTNMYIHADVGQDFPSPLKKVIAETELRELGGAGGTTDVKVGELIDTEGYSWEDIALNEDYKQRLMNTIQMPLLYPEEYEQLGIEPQGILLYGPPGTGKTLLGKVAASEVDANMLLLDCSDVFNKWVGDSEQNISQAFQKAREEAPTLIYIDEIDAIGAERGTGTTNTDDRVVAQLLQELDGLDEVDDHVRVIGATNRLEQVDPALKRSQRLGDHYEIPLPDLESREQIFRIHTTDEIGEGKPPVDSSINYSELAELSEGLSGADIRTAVQLAAEENLWGVDEDRGNISLERDEEDLRISMSDIEEALEVVDSPELESGPRVGFE